MGLVKRIFCKIHHGSVNLVCHRLRNTGCHTPRNTLLGIAVHEIPAFLFHDICLFLAHRTPHKVASSQCISAKVTHNLHNLLLVDNAAIGGGKYRFELRARISDIRMVIFSSDISRDKIHWPRAVKGDSCNHVLKILRFELLHKVFHALTFQLEHAVRLSGSEGSKHLLVIVVNVIHIDVDSGRFFHIIHGILDDGQRAQPQKIHL